jgi:F420H(2)-dependent biliverdin reductase
VDGSPGGAQKARNAERTGLAVVSQLDGPCWSTLEGDAAVCTDPVADAVTRCAARYRQPRVNPGRVVIEILVRRVLGNT